MRAKERYTPAEAAYVREHAEAKIVGGFWRCAGGALRVSVCGAAAFALGFPVLGWVCVGFVAGFVLLAGANVWLHRRYFGRWPWRE